MIVALPLGRPDPLEPPREHDDLRRRKPVAPVTTPWGSGWLVTSAELAARALADGRLGLAPPDAAIDVRASLFQDGAAHLRLRRLVATAFRPVRIAALRPRIAELAEEQVARVVAAGPPLDLVDALAAPLPVAVIAELVGVDRAHHDRFRALADAALDIDPMPTDPERAAAGARAWGDLQAFVTELVAARRVAPADDLVSDLVTAPDPGARLDDDELVALVAVLLAAGTLTVRNALVLAVARLLDEGTFTDLDPTGVDAVVEEVVRRAGAEPFPRFAQAELELGGVTIPRGSMVVVSLEAANHDPARFAEPRTFRPGRPEPHLGFGHGPHHCLGAALARAELAAVLGVLTRRLPTVRLAVPITEVPWRRGVVDSAPLALPVTW